MSRIAVGMSGGVDSTITAALLIEAGHEVEGLTLELLPRWIEEGSRAGDEAAELAQALDIRHHRIDMREEFKARVLLPFVAEYQAGSTPNPCVFCNEEIKFGLLFEWAMAQGFDYLATGHYVRKLEHETGTYLARAKDLAKDQSYFMYRLKDEYLDRLLFPLGELSKTEVRAIAHKLNLSVKDKPESQDICFCAEHTHVEIIEHYADEPSVPGEIYTTSGTLVGTHKGLIHYTIGQRKGLPAGLASPHYVVDMDADNNRLIIGSAEETLVDEVTLSSVVGSFELGARYHCQLRYRMNAQLAQVIEISDEGSKIRLKFDEALPAVAKGQAAVCYSSLGGYEIRIGGGVIECAG